MITIEPTTCDFCGSTDNVELWPWRSTIVNACMKCAEGWAAKGKEETKVVDITANEPHKCSEVICVKCGARWYAVRHINTLLKELHCKACGPGFVIETGEEVQKRNVTIAPGDGDINNRIGQLLKLDPLI